MCALMGGERSTIHMSQYYKTNACDEIDFIQLFLMLFGGGLLERKLETIVAYA